METENYTAFAEMEGALCSSVISDWLIDWFSYIFNKLIFLFVFRDSGDHAFFEGIFVAEDSAVSGFVDIIQKAVKNESFYRNLTIYFCY